MDSVLMVWGLTVLTSYTSMMYSASAVCRIPEYSSAPAPYFVSNNALLDVGDTIQEGDSIQVKCLIVEEFTNAVCLNSGDIEPIPNCQDVIYLIGGRSSVDNMYEGDIGVFLPQNVGSSTKITSQTIFNHGGGATGFVYQGRLYAFGGAGSGGRREYFDVAKNTWKRISATMSSVIYQYGALIGSKYYMCGNGRCESFDIDTHVWVKTADMSFWLENGCSFVIDHFWYLVGGQTTFHYFNIFQRYDTSSDSFVLKQVYPEILRFCGATALNGFGYVCGGLSDRPMNKCYKYDPSTDLWTQINSMKQTRLKFQMESYGSSLYAFMGRGSKEVERYDVNSGQWETLNGVADLIGRRLGFGIGR